MQAVCITFTKYKDSSSLQRFICLDLLKLYFEIRVSSVTLYSNNRKISSRTNENKDLKNNENKEILCTNFFFIMLHVTFRNVRFGTIGVHGLSAAPHVVEIRLELVGEDV